MYVRRIQYPVGQGCFHAGCISLGNEIHKDTPKFRYIYDCGSDNRKALDFAIDDFRLGVNKVHALFVSHLDRDHVNGLDRLLSLISVDTVFIPYLNDTVSVFDLIGADLNNQISASLVEVSITPQSWFQKRGVSQVVRVREWKNDSRVEQQFDPPVKFELTERAYSRDKLLELESGTYISFKNEIPLNNWVLVPHVHPVLLDQLDSFKSKIKSEIGGYLSVRRILEALKDNEKRKRLRRSYEEIINRGASHCHNRVSMSLYSGPTISSGNQSKQQKNLVKRFSYSNAGRYSPFEYNHAKSVGWIGTGDATLKVKQVRQAWESTYHPFYNQVSTLLLPHHGSKHNFHPDLLKPPNLEYCIASASDGDRYNHPANSVIDELDDQKIIFRHVSEQSNSGFMEVIEIR